MTEVFFNFFYHLYIMKFDVKSLLKDKNVLYVVLFIAVTNVFGYLMMHNFDAVVFFLVVGFLTSYFSKNMIVVMLTAIISTNLLIGTRGMGKTIEGMTDGDKDKDKKEDAAKVGLKKFASIQTSDSKESNPPGGDKEAETMQPLRPASAALDEEEGTGKKPKLDYAATLEAAYDNLDKMLGSDALGRMSDDTQNLIAKQQKLMDNIKSIEPMMARAEGMLDRLGGGEAVEKMMTSLTDKLGKLGGGN